MEYFSKKDIINYAYYILNTAKMERIDFDGSTYHHNTDYQAGIFVVAHGILSMSSLNRIGLSSFSEDELKRYSDIESHVNGIDNVSLSVAGLQDLYRGEEEYDSSSVDKLDIIVDSSIKAFRNSTHYGNEFLSRGDIHPKYIKSIDVRIEEYLKKIENSESINEIFSLVEKINSLLDIATTIKNSNILLREVSFNQNEQLDARKLSRLSRINNIGGMKC